MFSGIRSFATTLSASLLAMFLFGVFAGWQFWGVRQQVDANRVVIERAEKDRNAFWKDALKRLDSIDAKLAAPCAQRQPVK